MQRRFEVLDGWRGLSIIFVMLGHWFRLGPQALDINGCFTSTGMAVFFIMSGFLITNTLARDQKNLVSFLIRRFARVLPLAWLVLPIGLSIHGATHHQWISNLLFYANLTPTGLVHGIDLYWSLGVEIQFYLFIALLVWVFKKKAFLMLPIFCLGITAYRIAHGQELDFNTFYRVDEVLAGCTLAMLYNSSLTGFKTWLGKLNTPVLLGILMLAGNVNFGILNYPRPYIAMMLVGSTIFANHNRWWIRGLKNSKFLFYFASISYALYILHGTLDSTWLGQGETWIIRYLKRPLLLAITVALAHLSTHYYESFWIRKGKAISKRFHSDKALSKAV